MDGCKACQAALKLSYDQVLEGGGFLKRSARLLGVLTIRILLLGSIQSPLIFLKPNSSSGV